MGSWVGDQKSQLAAMSFVLLKMARPHHSSAATAELCVERCWQMTGRVLHGAEAAVAGPGHCSGFMQGISVGMIPIRADQLSAIADMEPRRSELVSSPPVHVQLSSDRVPLSAGMKAETSDVMPLPTDQVVCGADQELAGVDLEVEAAVTMSVSVAAVVSAEDSMLKAPDQVGTSEGLSLGSAAKVDECRDQRRRTAGLKAGGLVRRAESLDRAMVYWVPRPSAKVGERLYQGVDPGWAFRR